jgi:hypothetical protein
MRIRTSLLALALTAGTLTAASVALTQETPQPTENHALVLEGVGTWEGTLTSHFPGMPAEPVEARETVEAVGSFWTQATFECLFMGAPYKGTGCVGYDSTKEAFVGTWIDSMSSYLAVMEGEIDEKTGKLVMRWEAPGMTGDMVNHRSETVRKDDSYTSTFFMGEGDEEMKSMVIEMKRVSKKPVEAGSGR